MRVAGIAALVWLSLSLAVPGLCAQPKEHSQGLQQASPADQRGTEQSPVVVKVLTTPKTKEEAAEEQQKESGQSSADWWMVRLTAIIAAIGILQTIVFGRQAQRLKETIEKMDEIAGGQTSDMQASIQQATRGASAMERVANAMVSQVENYGNLAKMQREFWQRQMRAYVSVTVGGATFQERAKNLKFAGSPKIINDGMTPAHNVRSVIKAAIVKLPVDPAFDFNLPPGDATSAPALGPRHVRDIQGIVEDYIADQDVPGVKDLTAMKGLLVWGRVDYDDAFGDAHYANFAQIIYWLAEDAPRGIYEPRHNDSD